MKWANLINHHAPAETPAVSTPQPREPQVESSEFEREALYASLGATKNERWYCEASFKEKGITPDSNLAWMWIQKLRLRGE
jgi:hypothetical protein